MTSWLDRMSTAFGRFLDGPSIETRQAGFGLNLPPYQADKPRWLDANMAEYRKAYASQVAVYACVLARARGVSSATLRVYQDIQGDREEIPDHELRRLMQQPNPAMSEAEWLVMTQTLMDATGFCAIEKERSTAGGVIGLWHLRSDWLKEIRRSQRPSDWQYKVPGRDPVTIKAPDIIIIPGGPATDLGSTGMSPIAVALREVGIDTAMTDFLKLFIDKGGVPPYALVTPNAVKNQEEADFLRGLFEQTYGGFKNWTRTALLSGGLDVKKIGSNIDEFAYPELRALTEAHICSVFGVPPIIAGIQAGLDASTYSNYAQARKAFFEDTVAGLWARLDGALTRGLLFEFTDDPRISIEFDTSGVPALREDQTALWTRVGDLFGRGAMTLNQAQGAIGLPGFGEAGDVLYLPLAAQPTRPDDLVLLADMTAEPPQPVPAALGGGGSEDGSTDGNGTQKAGESGDNSGGQADGGTDRSRGRGQHRVPAQRPGQANDRGDTRISGHTANESAGRDVSVRLLTLPLETRARIATTNRRNVNRIAAKFTPRLRALFRKQGEAVATAYAKRSAEIDRAFKNGLEGDRDDYERRAIEHIPWSDLETEMERGLTGLYEAAGRLAFAGASSALDEVIDWSLANPKIRQVMKRLATRIVGISQTTRSDVAAVVTAGLEDGLTTPQIAENLKGLFAETYRGRALTIARTESMVSYSMATATAYRESGIVQAMQLHDNVLHTDEYGAADGLSCAQRDGVITDVDAVDVHIFSEHPNGSLAVSPLLVSPLGIA